jgi:hypothetical protein
VRYLKRAVNQLTKAIAALEKDEGTGYFLQNEANR